MCQHTAAEKHFRVVWLGIIRQGMLSSARWWLPMKLAWYACLPCLVESGEAHRAQNTSSASIEGRCCLYLLCASICSSGRRGRQPQKMEVHLALILQSVPRVRSRPCRKGPCCLRRRVRYSASGAVFVHGAPAPSSLPHVTHTTEMAADCWRGKQSSLC
jgi:hypothetical protein